MKFSEIWLREWINPSINNNELINQLTMAGFQVNESQSISNNKNKFYGVVIGEVIECNKHPNLSNTWVIKINNGNKKLINIVCDNVNCQKNIRVVVANIGAKLPNGKTITLRTIQGEKSEGILCTFSTLKLNNYKKNIIELPSDAPIGYNFYDYLGLNDNIIDINITPDRGDCLNIIGLAREIAAINQLKLKKLNVNTIEPTITDIIPIIVEVPSKCPKFLGRILKNINTSVPTPLKIQEKLRRCGVHLTNVVIDVTNYVLLELGHPIHAFDYDKIDQHIIYVRFSRMGEKLMLSDNNSSLKLFLDTLIIADFYKPLAIAGIVIGNESNVSYKTRNILLQSAFFDPLSIVEQSKLYNLHTFSSIRYERGVDYDLSELALNYTTSLLLNICSGQAGPIISIFNKNTLPKPNTIILNRSKLNKILGFYIKNKEVTRILKDLGFKVKFQNNFWEVLTPTWRFDISIEENLISEIIRIYGYDKIPQVSIHSDLTQPYRQTIPVSLSRVKTVLVDRGYQEVITYSFVHPDIQKLLYPQYIPLALVNPISLDMSVMRLSLWPGLIKTAVYNQNRQQKHMQLFESGICFIPEKLNDNHNHVSQKFMIAGLRSGLRYKEHWGLPTSIVDFYDIKGDVESILNIITKFNNKIEFKSYTHSALHPGKSAAIYLNKILIGYIGMIHPIIQGKLNLYLNTLVFELAWNAIAKFKLPLKINHISKFPKNYRDISLIVPIYVSASSIINECKKISIEQLIEIKLIDVYMGANIPQGYKSLTIKLTLQSKTHTLQEQEISKIINKCITVLKKRFHAILR